MCDGWQKTRCLFYCILEILTEYYSATHILNLTDLTRGKLDIFRSKVLTQISSRTTVALIYFNGNFGTKYLEFVPCELAQIWHMCS